MRISYFIILIFTVLLLNQGARAQTSRQLNIQFSMPQIALVDIEPGSNSTVSFNVQPSHESGEPPSVVSANQSLWINYTSAQSNSNTRNIYAQVTNGQVPQGLELAVTVSGFMGSGNGRQRGIGEGRVVLGNSPRRIISNIRNCFTGNGVNNGHRLDFSLSIQNYAQIYSNSATDLVVTYTISDN